jgi:PKD repeat protein
VDVISVYGEAYTNLSGTNFTPNWGQSTAVTVDYLVAGNKTLRYQNLNYQGTQYTNQNVSGYEYLHVDFWTPNSTALNFYLISPGKEKPYALPITAQTWVSVDIPLSHFVPPVNLADVFQFKVDGNGTVYFDNWYFWKSPSAPGFDATLSDLKVDGVTIDGFSPLILDYTMELPEGTTQVPVLTATTTDPQATHLVNNVASLPGTSEVVITSANGSVVKTYLVEFTVAGPVSGSEYCETEVWHFGNPLEVASAIFLTITNSGANSMLVEIESANDDPVDVLIVTGGSGATISDPNTTTPGKISCTLTWASNPPADVLLNVLWSKVSFPGNWMLIEGQITVPFEASCGPIAPKPYLALDIQDDFENEGWGNITNWKFQDAATLTNLVITTDPVNPNNHVADYNRSGTFDYTNAQFTLNHRMDLTSRKKFEMRVYFPSINDYTGTLTPTAVVKLQNSLLGANAWTTQTVKSKAITQFDQWVTLEFDFTTQADSVNYDQIVVQLGGENHFTPAQFYFDMFRLLPATTFVVADFTATPRSGYAPLTVQFSDYSTGNPIAWKWDFNNDGVTDSQVQNPIYTYLTPGVYSVKLRAETQFKFNEITKSDYITVSELVLPDYTYTNFDDQINVEFSGNPNNPETVANPDVSGINTSTNVGSWVKSAELDSHIFTVLDSKIDFTGGQVFHLKLHSPVIGNVLFKLEDNLNVALPVERSVAITKVNQWENLVFNFAGTGSGLYDKIIIFIDFGSANNNTFYFDDLLGPELEVPVFVKPYLALDVQDNFENDGYATISEWNFQDPGIVPLPVVVDPLNPTNHVAGYDRSGDFQYTNAQFILDHRMDLTNRNRFSMKVFFPSSNNYTGALTPTAAIKLQNSLLGGNAYTTQAEILVTVTQFDQWVNLTFDFSAPEITSRTDFDQVVVQFGGEGHLETGLFYFDDFRLLGIQQVIQQTVQLTGGWSGLSGYIVPDNTNLDDMLASLENLVILYNYNGIYMPSQGINSLVNWNPAQGYIIKLTGNDELIIAGVETASPAMTLAPGWSIVPVISACNVDVAGLLGSYEQIVMVKEVAGTGVYWPENGINSLVNLVPGKAYFFLTNAAVSFTYPACGAK